MLLKVLLLLSGLQSTLRNRIFRPSSRADVKFFLSTLLPLMRYTVKQRIMSKLQGVSKMTQTNTPHMTDYEAERRNFHLDVPAQFNFAIDVIGKWAADPNKLAMLWVGQHGEESHLTFAYFAEHSSRA